MNIVHLPTINKDRTLSFDGVADARYTFPVWSWMSSRGMKVFFHDKTSGKMETIGGKFFGEIEVLSAVVAHRKALTAPVAHKWNSESCSCGSDTALCQNCGKVACGTLMTWKLTTRGHNGNVCHCCNPAIDRPALAVEGAAK